MTLLGRRGECEVLDQILADALAGRSRVVVLRGEAGVGKTALLGYLSERDPSWHVANVVGVESEMELAYSGLHQLCATLLDHLDRLPLPQRDALATVFGLSPGPAPDRFLVGLATLTLLADAAEHRPLVCIVDDAQWLDEASAQILGFVARRLLAERIALVCAARTGTGDDVLARLPQLVIKGLDESDARALLLDNVHGPFDAAVCEQIITESHGNPLALLELPRTLNAAELAGGFGLPARQLLVGKVEQSYAKRLLLLPAETQLLVLAAAAEPLGDPLLLHRTAGILGLAMAGAGPAMDAGLLEIGARVEFAHPLVRSAAYNSAAADDRHRVHRALAEATDPATDQDRLAWHRARATPAPDEEVAAELERSAGRAQARGGLAAAAAFLERASALSPDPRKRARRALAAAAAKQLAGAPHAASTLLTIAVAGPLEELESALAQGLHGEISLDLRRGGEAVPLLLDAAGRLQSVEPELARETYLEALRAASIGGRLATEMLRRAAEASRNAPHPDGPPRPIDLLLAGLAVRFTDGYAASAALLKLALRAVRDEDGRAEQDARWPGSARRVAFELLDDETWYVFVHAQRPAGARQRRAGSASARSQLSRRNALLRGRSRCCGDPARRVRYDRRRDRRRTHRVRKIDARRLPRRRGNGIRARRGRRARCDRPRLGVVLTVGEHARALLYNGLGRYEAALSLAESASARDEMGVSVWSLPELVEAAARSGRNELAAAALERLTERTRAAGTEWALGIEARSRALLDEGALAEELYREAVDRLGRCRVAPERARAHLLSGEWLRREGRRTDAREQLRTAHNMLAAMGMEAFAERTRRELVGTGETVRKRRAETRDDLTAQEAQIAQLACDGYSNAEIGAQLFLSSRTVEWHLSKVFAKLEIGSRKELDAALRTRTREPQAA